MAYYHWQGSMLLPRMSYSYTISLLQSDLTYSWQLSLWKCVRKKILPNFTKCKYIFLYILKINARVQIFKAPCLNVKRGRAWLRGTAQFKERSTYVLEQATTFGLKGEKKAEAFFPKDVKWTDCSLDLLPNHLWILLCIFWYIFFANIFTALFSSNYSDSKITIYPPIWIYTGFSDWSQRLMDFQKHILV